MKKFTIFTVILTIVVVVVLAELMAKDYLPGFSTDKNVAAEGENMKLTLPDSLDSKRSIATNVLGSDGMDFNKLGADNTVLPTVEEVESPIALPVLDEDGADFLDPDNFTDPKNVTTQSPTQTTNTSGVKDFEDENSTPTVSANVYLREEQIKSAGFTGGYLEDEPLDGRLFKTIDISDLEDAEVTKTDIRTIDEILAKVYIFKIGISSSANDVYLNLKLKASQGLNVKLNETNEFGSASFFINDPVRSETAFLIVRISGLVYGFSYPKTYHSQVKNLIQLISWELG